MSSTHDAHTNAVPAGGQMSEAFWNERYGSQHSLWSGQPNSQLVAEAADLNPRAALDAGSGEGADAVWLAQRGWRVTAVDISSVALGRAAAHADDAGTDVARRITWVQADLTSWAPATTYELISVQFIQLPQLERAALHERLAASVSPEGVLLIVGHSPLDLETTAHRPRSPELFFTATEIAATLDPDGWEIVVSQARPRAAIDPEGNSITVHDEVLTARRRP
jgi:trans-aconitate methyltransferase